MKSQNFRTYFLKVKTKREWSTQKKLQLANTVKPTGNSEIERQNNKILNKGH